MKKNYLILLIIGLISFTGCSPLAYFGYSKVPTRTVSNSVVVFLEQNNTKYQCIKNEDGSTGENCGNIKFDKTQFVCVDKPHFKALFK